MSKIGKTSYSSLTRALHIADTPINHYHVVSTIFLSLPPRHQHVSAFINLLIQPANWAVRNSRVSYAYYLVSVLPDFAETLHHEEKSGSSC